MKHPSIRRVSVLACLMVAVLFAVLTGCGGKPHHRIRPTDARRCSRTSRNQAEPAVLTHPDHA